MLSSDSQLRFEQILANIEHILSFVEGVTLDEYRNDLKTRSAVERQIGNLTEAAFRLGDRAAESCPQIDWRGVRGMGNFLRHQYEDIQDEMVWNVIKIDLPYLEAAVRETLARGSH